MQNSKISFKSGIRFTNQGNYLQIARNFTQKKGVLAPYTHREIVRAPQVYTQQVSNCTTCGIKVLDGKKNIPEIVKVHIDPDNKENTDFSLVEQAILLKIDKAIPLQALLLGCMEKYEKSVETFNNFKSFLGNKLKIPYSEFKGIPRGHFIETAGDAIQDEWTIYATAVNTSDKILLKKNIYQNFNGINLCSLDNLIVD